MHFNGKINHFIGFIKKKFYIYVYKMFPMENYLIVLGLYLILMLFFKIYFAVSARE